MRGKAQRASRPVQTRLQYSRVTGPNFTKCLSDVAIAKFRAQSQNEGRIDRALATHPYFNVGTYSVNLVNIDPVHSEITGLQGDS